MKNAAPALFLLGWDSIWESGKGFGFQIPFVRAVWSDGLSVSFYVLNQPFAAEIRVTEKPFAKVNRHRHVDFSLVLIPRFLGNFNFSANAVAEIEHGQMGVNLLQNEFVRPAVQVQQTDAVFQKPNVCFDFPAHMV